MQEVNYAEISNDGLTRWRFNGFNGLASETD